MNISLLDVVGPVMIGPSSSHTAGAAKLAKMIIEECTDINLFVGTAMNVAHQNSNLPFELSVRMNLVDQLRDVAKKLGKQVKVKYY